MQSFSVFFFSLEFKRKNQKLGLRERLIHSHGETQNRRWRRRRYFPAPAAAKQSTQFSRPVPSPPVRTVAAAVPLLVRSRWRSRAARRQINHRRRRRGSRRQPRRTRRRISTPPPQFQSRLRSRTPFPTNKKTHMQIQPQNSIFFVFLITEKRRGKCTKKLSGK